MPCHFVKLPDGGFAIVTTARKRLKRCYVDGCSRFEDVLCDWPTGEGKTCDRPCCRSHAKRIGENLDYCVQHALESAREQAIRSRSST